MGHQSFKSSVHYGPLLAVAAMFVGCGDTRDDLGSDALEVGETHAPVAGVDGIGLTAEVDPEAILPGFDLSATQVGTSADIELTWADVGAGSYEVWRSTEPYFAPGDPSGVLVGTTSGTVLVDAGAACATCDNSYYVVRTDGAVQTSTTVGVHVLAVESGFNFVPLSLIDPSITTASTLVPLAGAGFVNAFYWWYPGQTWLQWWIGSPFGEWTHRLGDAPIITLSLPGSETRVFTGYVPDVDELQLPLVVGDNYVSLPLTHPDMLASEVLAAMPGAVGVRGWDPVTQTILSHYGPGDPEFDVPSGGFVLVDMGQPGAWPFPVPPPVCALDGDLGAVVPASFPGDTSASGNDMSGTCGGDVGNDQALSFTAPTDAWYRFSADSPGFDSVVYLRQECDGAEIRCEDRVAGSGTPETLDAWIEAGESVVAVVDGAAAGGGQYSLDVTEAACPHGNLGDSVPATVSGTTTGMPDTHGVTSCGDQPNVLFGFGNPDRAFGFTAPTTGMYVFDDDGTVFGNDMLSLWSGIECNDPFMLQCESFVPLLGFSQVFHWLEEGQQVSVAIDATNQFPPTSQGEFTINVRGLEGVCPDGDLGSVVPQSVSGDTSTSDNTMLGRCRQGYQPGGDSPDDIYTFTAPQDDTYTFNTVGTTFDSALYILDGAGCAGEALACDRYLSAPFGDDPAGLVLDLVAGQTVTVVVDGEGGQSGPYTLNIGTFSGSCPDADLGSMVPQVVMGDTSQSDNTSFDDGECSPVDPVGAHAGDDAYTFTAPATSGYTFSTLGSSFDTVLYARDAACGVEAFECADDYVDGNTDEQSLMYLELDAGETITVVVDGRSGAEGPYTLAIEENTCPDLDIGSAVPQTVLGTTVGQPDTATPPCWPFSHGPDIAHAFTAPADGTYIIDTNGTTFQHSLYVESAACGGASLGCNVGGVNNPIDVTVDLLAGEEIIIYVDSSIQQSGDFTLNITQ
ncbi:MAG: hypothetical protein K0V04_34165 [Deltaproteobacteria bacterium]|nr:hypothetical protein [Deltaproteobacteria bacterium]